jgi:SAM-dependent methyltransferase
MLTGGDPVLTWGWGTPAGRLRAARRAELIIAGARLGPGTRALEIGCGTGMFTEMFARAGGTILAVDISPDLLERARGRGLPAERVRFLERRFEECDVEGPFEAVIGSSVLHHLDIGRALPRIFSLLSPGGRMCFAEPNFLNPQVCVERIPFLRRWMRHISPDETAFVAFRLAGALRGEGFSEVEITPFDWLHPATPEGLIGAVGAAGRILERTPILREFAGSLLIRCRRPC